MQKQGVDAIVFGKALFCSQSSIFLQICIMKHMALKPMENPESTQKQQGPRLSLFQATKSEQTPLCFPFVSFVGKPTTENG